MAETTATHSSETVSDELLSAIRRILVGVETPGIPLLVEPLAKGGNNRIYLVRAGGQGYVAKWYYDDAAVFRERMRAEYEFILHARQFGITCVPRPLGSDAQIQVALYEKIDGRRLIPGELSSAHVIAAARFFARLNAPEVRAAGQHLQAASDACFSVTEHVKSVDVRIDRIAGVGGDPAATEFMARLGTAWQGIKHRLDRANNTRHELSVAWRCLSPSDFGFHNALLRDDGTLCFLDFEYAGWDDPAKMIGDFFSHPGVPVSTEHLDAFIVASLQPFTNADAIAERARLLMDVARVRWCCIVMNDFLPQVASRRQFADPAGDSAERRCRQLAKAEIMLTKINC